MSTNKKEKHWIEVGSEEMKRVNPSGTPHPRIVSDNLSGFYMWNPEMTKLYGPFDTYDEVAFVLGASLTLPPIKTLHAKENE